MVDRSIAPPEMAAEVQDFAGCGTSQAAKHALRDAAQREWFAAHRQEVADASYRALRAKCSITVER